MRVKGICHAIFAYDVGQAIDLRACAARMKEATQPAWMEHPRRAPSYFQTASPPLRIRREGPPAPSECSLFDFGAVSVEYEIPFEGDLAALVAMSCRFSEEGALKEESRRLVEEVLAALGDAVRNAHLWQGVEDYLIFEVREWTPEAFPEDPSDLARILRSEWSQPSAEEAKDATSSRISFEPSDLLFVDWNAALVFDKDSDDARAVLEFANVQLLEMRFLDAKLDRALDTAYEAVAAPPLRFPRPSRISLERVARLQVDGAILYERVSNALKLLGDQYLARVYRLAAQRFHLGEWNAGILRKLETLESIYQKLSDRAAARRMELIEWLVVALIALSIALPFLHG